MTIPRAVEHDASTDGTGSALLEVTPSASGVVTASGDSAAVGEGMTIVPKRPTFDDARLGILRDWVFQVRED